MIKSDRRISAAGGRLQKLEERHETIYMHRRANFLGDCSGDRRARTASQFDPGGRDDAPVSVQLWFRPLAEHLAPPRNSSVNRHPTSQSLWLWALMALGPATMKLSTTGCYVLTRLSAYPGEAGAQFTGI